ncbi:MAG TPA: DUF4956 domain-containing protein [Ignavibacteriaceae bacterium]|nr:DUF4956 domain-containing protein [Ignavibacteriaceae bacterium]
MLHDFQNILNFSLTVGTVIENIVVSLFCSLLIALFYRWTYKGAGYTLSFIHSLVILSMITAIVIMVIGNNLARAFGLVGAMSIIRFRTPIKEPMDIIYIFFSLAIGMAAGVGLHMIAVTGTIVVGGILLILTKANLFSINKDKYLLEFNFLPTGNGAEPPYIAVLNSYCKKYNLINIKSVGDEDQLGLSFYVNVKNKNLNDKFIRDLTRIEGVFSINLFFNEESI